jgi:hypothetical protein
MGGIFISYRRQDAPGYAGRLYDSLAAHYGDQRIFMDIGAIQPGQDFTQRIDEALSSCDVLLAVIGPQWCTITDAGGSRRLEDPEDYVGLEVRTALTRPDVKVIPVLVGGGRMPAREEIPPGLADLRKRQALELSEARWRYDVERLIATLEGPPPPDPQPDPRRTPEPEPDPRPVAPSQAATPLVAVALGVLVGAIPAYAAYRTGTKIHKHNDVTSVAHLAVPWALFWAALCAVVCAVVAAMGPDRRQIVPQAAHGLLIGLLAGGLGGAVNGVARIHGHHLKPGIVLGFAVTGAVIGLSRIAGGSRTVGFVGGAALGALGGVIVAGNIAHFWSQAIPAAIILIGIAVLQLVSTTAEKPVAALTPAGRH